MASVMFDGATLVVSGIFVTNGALGATPKIAVKIGVEKTAIGTTNQEVTDMKSKAWIVVKDKEGTEIFPFSIAFTP